MTELELLVFAVEGIRIGVATDQIAGVITLEQAEATGIEVGPLHDIIPFDKKPLRYNAPKALLTRDDPPCAVMIESPDDIISVAIDSIRTLPPAVSACNPCRAIWGIALQEGGGILLVDFLRPIAPEHHSNTHLAFSNTSEEAAT